MSNEVIIKDAVKRYGDFIALNGVSLDIREGEFFTLLGPSGCGKSTALNLICGLLKPIEGKIFFKEAGEKNTSGSNSGKYNMESFSSIKDALSKEVSKSTN